MGERRQRERTKEKCEETNVNKSEKKGRRNFSFLRDERHSLREVSSTVMLNARSGFVRRSTCRENGGKYDSRGIQFSDWRERNTGRAG